MSIIQRGKDKTYHFDFECEGHRFTGSTRTTNKREALRIEQVERAKAKVKIASGALARRQLTLEYVCGRYWEEVGQYHAQPDTTLTNLIRLQDFFGKATPLAEIDDDAVARMVAWRRAQTAFGRQTVKGPDGKPQPAARISAATVNRTTTEVLQKLFARARTVWRETVAHEPAWRAHLLAEPAERVREIAGGDEAAFLAAIPDDYRPLVRFARASGLRLSECLLRKDQVDLISGRILTIGKGGKTISVRITAEMRAILMAEMANPTDHVFTYKARRPKPAPGRQPGTPDKAAGRLARGTPLPITPSGVKSAWRRARAASGGAIPADFRFHDLRHDFATKLLRATGNLRLVQRALNHSNIETTTKYAHVLDEDVLAGMEEAAKRRKGE